MRAHYVHKIAPKDSDIKGPFTLPSEALQSVSTLGAALRAVGVLQHGQRVKRFRVEDGQVVVFPAASIWHSIVLR